MRPRTAAAVTLALACVAAGYGLAGLRHRHPPAPAIAECVPRADGTLPDPRCTPGVVDGTVTREMLCDGRHPTSQRRDVPDGVRDAVLRDYGYDPDTFEGELDHLIPLSLGGGNQPRNLWPQPGRIPNPKDAVENRLRREVCAGRRSLDDAQHAIATDWREAA